MTSNTQSQYTFRKLTGEDVNKALNLASKVFCNHEPMCSTVGVTRDEFNYEVGGITKVCCESGLSFVAEDKNRDFVSLCLSLPYTDYTKIRFPQKTPSIAPVIELLNHFKKLPGKEEECYLIYIMATDENHIRKGLCKQIIDQSMNAAKKAGFKYVVVDVTNISSQKMASSLQFKSIQSENFRDFAFQNKKPFETITVTPHADSKCCGLQRAIGKL